MGQVLLSLLILLDSLGSAFWQGEQPEYPRIVFDAIKDSVTYCNLILENKFEGEQPWYLAWYATYLHSIRHLPVYGEVLAKMVDFLCEERRLVIELDGAEHRGRRAYRDDRHRDYELLRAGYAVVRIPNDEIVEDFARTLEKIRSVVRLRRSVNGGLK